MPVTTSDGVEIPYDEWLRKTQDHCWWSFFGYGFISTICLVIVLFIKEDLRRLNFGKQNNNSDDAGVEMKDLVDGPLSDEKVEDGYKRLDDERVTV